MSDRYAPLFDFDHSPVCMIFYIYIRFLHQDIASLSQSAGRKYWNVSLASKCASRSWIEVFMPFRCGQEIIAPIHHHVLRNPLPSVAKMRKAFFH